MRTTDEICAAIRLRATGRIEWRVQDPVERCYCATFSRDEYSNPECQAREWLADHRRRFPDSRHAGYEVAEVRVYSELETLALEAADALAATTPASTTGAAELTGAQMEAEQRDQARLDWLVGQDDCVVNEGTNGFWLCWIDEHDPTQSKYQSGSHPTARAAIDAAMAEQQEGNHADQA